MANCITRVALLSLTLSITACASTDSQVQVFINSGAKQCLGLGKSLQQTAAMLNDAGVEASEGQCGKQQGLLFPAVCGGGTPDVNVHDISESDLARAKQVGFKAVSEADVQLNECPTKKPVKQTINKM